MNRKWFLQESLLLGQSVLGASIFALAYRIFIVPSHLYSGGTTGISQILKLLLTQAFGLQLQFDLTGLIFWFINIPLLFLGYRYLGKMFMFRTIISVAVQSFLMAVIPAPAAMLFHDQLLDCVIGGCVAGFGVGITLKAGGSGGGTDIIGLYSAIKFPNFSVGKLSILLNLFIYLFVGFRYGLEPAVYSMIYTLAVGFTVDKIHAQNIRMTVFLISRSETIGTAILNGLRRGVTTWQGWGEYTGEQTYIHMIVLNKLELTQLKKIIQANDPTAFLFVCPLDSVLGNFEKHLEVE